jgi:hypothetical protein
MISKLSAEKNYANNIAMIEIIDLLQATSEHSAHLVCSYGLSMPLQAAKTEG